VGVKKKKRDKRPDRFKPKIPTPQKPPKVRSDLEAIEGHSDWVIEQHALRLGEDSQGLTEEILSRRTITPKTVVSAVPLRFEEDGKVQVIVQAEQVVPFENLTESVKRIWITPTLGLLTENPPKLLWEDGEFVPEPTVWGRCNNCKTKQEVRPGNVCKWQGCPGKVHE